VSLTLVMERGAMAEIPREEPLAHLLLRLQDGDRSAFEPLIFTDPDVTGHDPAASPFCLPRVSTLNSMLSERIDYVLARALELDPSRRFESARAIQLALEGRQELASDGVDFGYVKSFPGAQEAQVHHLPGQPLGSLRAAAR
jgi:hypothetical protein